MNNYYDFLRKYQLIRGEDMRFTLSEIGNGKNDLEAETWERLFGVQGGLTLTPNDSQIVNFAVMNYLFGLFGITVSSFTAIPSGYIASFQKSGEFYGTFISGDLLTLKNEITKLCDEQIKQRNYGNGIYAFIKNRIEVKAEGEIKEKNSAKAVDLLSICSEISEEVNSTAKSQSNSIQNALEKYKSVNIENCRYNHTLICNMLSGWVYGDNESQKNQEIANLVNEVRKVIEYDGKMNFDKFDAATQEVLSESQDNKQEIKKILTAYDMLLYHFILPRYRTYRGKDNDGNKIPQDGQILNSIRNLQEYLKTNGIDMSTKMIIEVSNICSTDYSADIVETIFGKIISCPNEIKESLSRVIPPQSGNEGQKENARRSFGRY